MTTNQVSDSDSISKMLRLILTDQEWHSLRVMAAERDTSMQAVVADTMRREITKHIRARAAEKVLAKGGA